MIETTVLPTREAPPVASSPAIAAAIVNYYKAGRLIEGVHSLLRQTMASDIAVAVVENSNDARESEALRSLPESICLIEPRSNIGYTRGCNLAVQSLPHSRYVLLCNPDIVWDHADALEQMVAIADANPSIGVLAPLQFGDDGARVETARTFPTLAEQAKRRLKAGAGSELHISAVLSFGHPTFIDVDWVQSSCVLIRRTVWDRIGGLDERYFLFMSDVELGRATWDAGLRVCLTSAVQVRADCKRASSGGILALFTSMTQRRHLADAIRYYLKNGILKLRRSASSDATVRSSNSEGVGAAT